MPKRKKVRGKALDADNPARAKRFLEAREAAGLTQEDVSAAVGLSVTSISRWETKGSVPAGDVLVKAARLYRRSPEWLVFGTGPIELEVADDPPYEAYYAFISGTWPESPMLRDWMLPKLRAMRFPGEPEVETYRRAVTALATIRLPDQASGANGH